MANWPWSAVRSKNHMVMNFFFGIWIVLQSICTVSLPPSPCLGRNGSTNTRNSPFKLQGKVVSTYQVHQNVGCSRRIVCFFVQICTILWRLHADSKATCRRWGKKPQNRPLSICYLITSRYTMLKHTLFTTCHKTSVLDHLQGVVLTNFSLHIPGSLSLSLLHWKREQEERSGGVGPWLGPTTQLPFLANVFHTQPAYRWLFLVIGQYW